MYGHSEEVAKALADSILISLHTLHARALALKDFDWHDRLHEQWGALGHDINDLHEATRGSKHPKRGNSHANGATATPRGSNQGGVDV